MVLIFKDIENKEKDINLVNEKLNFIKPLQNSDLFKALPNSYFIDLFVNNIQKNNIIVKDIDFIKKVIQNKVEVNIIKDDENDYFININNVLVPSKNLKSKLNGFTLTETMYEIIINSYKDFLTNAKDSVNNLLSLYDYKEDVLNNLNIKKIVSRIYFIFIYAGKLFGLNDINNIKPVEIFLFDQNASILNKYIYKYIRKINHLIKDENRVNKILLNNLETTFKIVVELLLRKLENPNEIPITKENDISLLMIQKYINFINNEVLSFKNETGVEFLINNLDLINEPLNKTVNDLLYKIEEVYEMDMNNFEDYEADLNSNVFEDYGIDENVIDDDTINLLDEIVSVQNTLNEIPDENINNNIKEEIIEKIDFENGMIDQIEKEIEKEVENKKEEKEIKMERKKEENNQFISIKIFGEIEESKYEEIINKVNEFKKLLSKLNSFSIEIKEL